METSYSEEERGFTLIELLVVVSIIGFLTSIVISFVTSARTKAQYAAAKSELTQFVKVSVIAQGERRRRLQDITGSNCSDCVCRSINIRNIPDSDACYVNWITALSRIQSATGGVVNGFTNMSRDPWGSPYALDENERESGPTDCTLDTIRSAGPDGTLGTGDDQGYTIPLSASCP